MSKRVEEYIENYTRRCSNVCSYNSMECNTPWLTPDHARRAVEIAREEVINKAIEWLKAIESGTKITDIDEFIEAFKHDMEEKV